MRQEIKTFGKRTAGLCIRVVHIGQARLFFSYATLVAIDFGDGVQVRTQEPFSSTTSKHRTLMGCANFKQVPEQEFAEMVARLALLCR